MLIGGLALLVAVGVAALMAPSTCVLTATQLDIASDAAPWGIPPRARPPADRFELSFN
jgi:hypothetical protein